MIQNTERKVTLERAIEKILPVSCEAAREAKRRWDQVAKPLNSLGVWKRIWCGSRPLREHPHFLWIINGLL